MVRTPRCDERGMKKGTWTPEEDRKLIAYVTKYGYWNWRQLPKYAGLSRCGKSCRLRWLNYLRPNIKRGNYTKEEEEIIIRLHEKLGNKWSVIASELEGRTDNDVKNHWHTNLKKRLTMNTASSSSSVSVVENSEAPKSSEQPKIDSFEKVEATTFSQVEILDYPELWSPQPSSSELSWMTSDTKLVATIANDSFVAEDNATSSVAAMESFYRDFGDDFWSEPFMGAVDYDSGDQSGLYAPMMESEFFYQLFDGDFLFTGQHDQGLII